MEAGQGSRPPAGGERSTWIAFAGVMMVILGFLDALWGLAAILNNEVVVVGGHRALIFGSRPGNLPLGDQRRHADRLVLGRTAMGLPDDHSRRRDHLPAHGQLV